MTATLADAARLLVAPTADLAEHRRRLGPTPEWDAGHLLALVADSGLTGRGGAGFPTSRKLAAVAARGRAVVIANGAEGEPASSKDRALLSRAPHLVLDGLVLAARTVGATRAYLYAPADLLESVLEPAVRQRRDRPAVRLVASPDRFLAGQESAAVAAVQGRAAIPVTTPPAVYERGVAGYPTLVQNVETLAHLALIARYGAGWFRAVGTAKEPGTRLVTVSGPVRAPGVYEVACGLTLGAVLDRAGGVQEPLGALLIGGYHGGWVRWSTAAARLPMTHSALAVHAASPGAGVVVALPATSCGLRAGAEILAYLADQNAGQCGPCRNGLPELADHLSALAGFRARPVAVRTLESLAAQVDGRGACHHPTGAVRLVRSTLRAFADDVGQHLRGCCSARAFSVRDPGIRSDRGRQP